MRVMGLAIKFCQDQKQHPSHLRYAYLCSRETLTVDSIVEILECVL
jgi:hypothetical protein